MDDTNSLIEQRKAKLAALRAKGIDPFKNKFTPTESCAAARKNYTEGREVAVAGRITAHRDMGKSMFIDVRDQSGRIQVYAQKNTLGDEQWNIFTHLDLADFIGVKGTLFTTKTGEISIKLAGFTILAKALRPPPAKWHGLEDTEIRYRQRYLDLMANPEVKDVFLKRSQIIREIRNFLQSRGFVEVETPMMQAIPGGAAAQPFKTHHNALGCDFYLRIALELYLKRLLVGGVDKVFEIGRNFRNEGLSRKHNPEFTMLEAYQAFGDYESMMELVQSMICHVAQKVFGTLKIRQERKTGVQYFISKAAQVIENFYQIKAKAITIPPDLAKETMNYAKLLPVDFIKQIAELEKSLKETSSYIVAQKALELIEKHWKEISSTHHVDAPSPDGPALVVIKTTLVDLEIIVQNLRSLAKEEIVDLTTWRRAKYKDLIREKAGADWFEISSGSSPSTRARPRRRNRQGLRGF